MKGIWFAESKVKLYSIHICLRHIPESNELHIAVPRLKNSGDHSELRAPIYQNQTSFPHALSLKRSQ